MSRKRELIVSEAETLLPCPFCGGEAKLLHSTSRDYWTYQVECTRCQAATASSKGRGYAIEFWNARAKP